MKFEEFEVGKTTDIADAEMKEVYAGETKVLLARIDGKIHAVGAECTHYGAPLVDGYLSGDRIVCPWHHACFSARTGKLQEPPALDSLPCYDVKISDDRIAVRIPSDDAEMSATEPASNEGGDDRSFVILGAGAAGLSAAKTLRQEGFAGRLTMITGEDRAPYDRPNLSKDYLQGKAEPEWMPLREREFFENNNIEQFSGVAAEKVDTDLKTVTLVNGKVLNYDSILIATGGIPRRLPFQKTSQKNVFTYRSFSDADAVIETLENGKRAVIIGASFIGMETAASLRSRGCDVTVVAPDKVPFEKTLGAEIGGFFKNVHEENGVKFKLESEVEDFEGDENVTGVLLKSGDRIAADLVIIGIGVAPAAEFQSGIELHRDGGIVADEFLSAGKDVYAAGDIVHFPYRPAGGELTRIEHWRTAMQLGNTAAQNMIGMQKPFTSIPFFWTTQFDATLNYVGHLKEWDEIIYRGRIDSGQFLAFYVKDGKIRAVAGMNRDRELAEFEEMMRLDKMPAPSDLNHQSASND
ncbi:MAG: FAD-dependent oxidoreductase [Pyrinomonadaceae bacterium]|nr:FAD-dependent oxidoreductase [Pyrinomonadaceae bacterium]